MARFAELTLVAVLGCFCLVVAGCWCPPIPCATPCATPCPTPGAAPGVAPCAAPGAERRLPDGGPAPAPLPPPADGEAARPSAAATLRTLEAQPVTLQFVDLALPTALQLIATASGVPVRLSEPAEKLSANTTVDLAVENVVPRVILDLLTEPNELAWRPDGDGVLVTSLAELAESPGMVLRFYDVKDLIQDGAIAPEGIVEAVREAVADEGAFDDPASMEMRNGILILRAARETHDAAAAWLDGLRAAAATDPK